MDLLRVIFRIILEDIFGYELIKIRKCYIYGIYPKRAKHPVYIGSTEQDVNKRFAQHIGDNTYSNYELWLLSKKKQLEIKILETCKCKNRFKIEYEYIDNHKKYKLLNKKGNE